MTVIGIRYAGPIKQFLCQISAKSDYLLGLNPNSRIGQHCCRSRHLDFAVRDTKTLVDRLGDCRVSIKGHRDIRDV